MRVRLLVRILSSNLSHSLRFSIWAVPEEIRDRVFQIENVLLHITFIALSLLRSKKQYYFAIDELNSQLLYYKEEADLVAKREPVGALPLSNAAFTISEGNERTFVLHSGDKVVELEAPNPESCECWLEALSHRALTSQRKRTSSARASTKKREKGETANTVV
ncbi:hypothetical protein Q1695_000001 [Nippostrongylus brasiliensis]|nr:hypothetical protein Q1695_000001 [Nippostrongylus brasiliensis]